MAVVVNRFLQRGVALGTVGCDGFAIDGGKLRVPSDRGVPDIEVSLTVCGPVLEDAVRLNRVFDLASSSPIDGNDALNGVVAIGRIEGHDRAELGRSPRRLLSGKRLGLVAVLEVHGVEVRDAGHLPVGVRDLIGARRDNLVAAALGLQERIVIGNRRLGGEGREGNARGGAVGGDLDVVRVRGVVPLHDGRAADEVEVAARDVDPSPLTASAENGLVDAFLSVGGRVGAAADIDVIGRFNLHAYGVRGRDVHVLEPNLKNTSVHVDDTPLIALGKSSVLDGHGARIDSPAQNGRVTDASQLVAVEVEGGVNFTLGRELDPALHVIVEDVGPAVSDFVERTRVIRIKVRLREVDCAVIVDGLSHRRCWDGEEGGCHNAGQQREERLVLPHGSSLLEAAQSPRHR